MDKLAIYNYIFGKINKDAYHEFIISDARINISRINTKLYSHIQYLIDSGKFNASAAVMNYYEQPLHTINYVNDIIECMRASSNVFHFLCSFIGTKRAIKLMNLQPLIDEIIEAIDLTIAKQTQLFHFHVGAVSKNNVRPEALVEEIDSKGLLKCC